MEMNRIQEGVRLVASGAIGACGRGRRAVRLAASFAFGAVLSAFAGEALAAPVLDQGLLDVKQAVGGIGYGAISEPIVAQTFTVGLAGELSRVAFAVADFDNSGGPLIAEIRSTAAGVPTGTILASVALATSQVPDVVPNPIGAGDLTSIDLSVFDIQVNVGDVLAVALSEPNPGGNLEWFGRFDGYGGGRIYFDVGAGFVTLGSNLDLYFQTFVDPDPQAPQAVPEPATLGMVGVGLLALRAWRRRLLRQSLRQNTKTVAHQISTLTWTVAGRTAKAFRQGARLSARGAPVFYAATFLFGAAGGASAALLFGI